MEKKVVLFFSFLLFLFFYACNDASTPKNNIIDDVGLDKLMVESSSVLEKMDKDMMYDFGDFEKYTISLTVRPKNQSAVDVLVTVNEVKASGSVPYYSCGLVDGKNEIKVILSSKKDVSNKKVYTIKINKKKSNISDEESSKLKELKLDGKDILSLLDDKNVVTVPEVSLAKDKVNLYVLPHNLHASIDVSNDGNSIEKINDNTYNVGLSYGQNEIRIVVSSDAEGRKLHIIRIYREEDLRLKSFTVESNEQYDEDADKFKVSTIRFSEDKTEVAVVAKARYNQAKVFLKYSEKEIEVKNDSCKVPIEPGRNAIEVIVKGKDGKKSKSYNTITFLRISHSSVLAELKTLRADDEDVLHLLSKDNMITLAPCDNNKTSLKVEARAASDISIKLLNNGSECSGEGTYNVSLNEGNNKIAVQLYSGKTLATSYFIFIRRYPPKEEPNNPSGDEVQVNIVLSDGVNGSSIDGSYIDILKTKDSSLVKRVLVRDGKAKANLSKNEFYDFKVEGRNTDYSQTRYAASDVISYYVDEKTKTVPIVQFPLQRVTRPAEAPSISEFKFGGSTLNVGEENSTDQMKNIEIKVLTSSPIEALSWNSPTPMLAVGYVPTTGDDRNDISYANQAGHTVKNADGKFESRWTWSSLYAIDPIKGDSFDVVVVLYDVANNRLEYHIRLKTSSAVTEDASIIISDFSMKFESYPTPSRIFSVGGDAFTNNSSHYSNELRFKVKKGTKHVPCMGVDIYRKCVGEEADFRLVRHFVYKSPKTSSYSVEHKIGDSDGVLEDEKTYQYKVVAYTTDGKKSKLDSSPMRELKVPKSTSLLLDYPVNRAITKNEAESMDYVFKFSNPKILETAKEIRLGFLISNRRGDVPYCSKFKYVFDDSNGKDEIYFATLNDAKVYQGYYYDTEYSRKRNSVTNKKVEDLIRVDKATGTIRLTKDFVSLSSVNLARYPKAISYEEGFAYYWDVLDWGVQEYTDFDDRATKIISKEIGGVTITSFTNDYDNGNNAWNGRAEFTIRFD